MEKKKKTAGEAVILCRPSIGKKKNNHLGLKVAYENPCLKFLEICSGSWSYYGSKGGKLTCLCFFKPIEMRTHDAAMVPLQNSVLGGVKLAEWLGGCCRFP